MNESIRNVIFYFILIMLGVGIGWVVDSHALPSDLIQTVPLPGKMSLSGTVAESAKAIDATNPELTKAAPWKTKDLGIYNSEKVTIDQDAETPVGVPEKLLNFSSAKPLDLNKTSVGNVTGNVTIINETMAWF
jgi:hypothetical protein